VTLELSSTHGTAATKPDPLNSFPWGAARLDPKGHTMRGYSSATGHFHQMRPTPMRSITYEQVVMRVVFGNTLQSLLGSAAGLPCAEA